MDEREDRSDADSVPPIEEAETHNNSAQESEHDQSYQDGFIVGEDDEYPVEEYLTEAEPSSEHSEGNVAGSLDRLEPLEPQEINLENALFVLLGVFLVVGFLVGALVGL